MKTTRRAPYSRSALLWAAVSFVGVQTAFFAVAETRARYLRDPEFFARLPAAAEPAARLVVCLGTSRMEWGVQRRVMEPALADAVGSPVRVVNLGTGGWEMYHALQSYHRLRREGIRPDLALVEVMPMSLHEQRGLDDDEKRLPHEALDAADLALLRTVSPERADTLGWLAARAVPTYAHRHGVMRTFAPGLGPAYLRPTKSYRDDFRVTLSEPRRASALLSLKGDHGPELAAFRLGARSCGVLERLLADLAADGVSAAIVWMPEGPAYRSWYGPGTESTVSAYLRDVSRRFATPLVRCREWCDEEAFNDSHHLTAAGADAFSARLAAEVAGRLR